MNRTGEKKIFNELDVHQCLESRNKRFWPQEDEMS